MIILYAIIALLIAWIWVDYYRLIDIFDKNRLAYFVFIFILGCFSVLFVIGINKFLLDPIEFGLNGGFLNDFFYSVIGIGMIEELAKFLPFVLFYFLFKDKLTEPIDYLAYLCTSALGFSAVENAMYFYNHGPHIINGRAILATVGHMFDTALIAYGFILNRFRYKKSNLLILALFFLLASLSHGFYDFWLLHEGTKQFGWLITVGYFMITISLFATIINNALNNSSFFSYKKIINPDQVGKRLITYYGTIFFIQIVLLTILDSFVHALGNFIGAMYSTGFIVIITTTRLSRFKLIQGRWNQLKIEFPFGFKMGDPYGMKSNRLLFSIKGDSFNETQINAFYEENFQMRPLTKRRTYIQTNRLAFMERILFLKDDESFYVIKLYKNQEEGDFEKLIMRPKKSGKTKSAKGEPIVALLKFDHIENIEDQELTIKDFKFIEWVVLKSELAQ